MTNRKWDPQTKATIVLQGLKGRPVADICNEHQVSQAQYYQWREQFLAKMPQVFVQTERREQTLASENTRLKQIIGDLTMELKQASAANETPDISGCHGTKFTCGGAPQGVEVGSYIWACRRTWAHLRYIDGLEINKKRVLRLMRQQELGVKPNTRLKATRTRQWSKPRPTRLGEWWGIDITKVMVEDFERMDIVVLLDWYTKKITGYSAGVQCRAKHWLEALDNGTIHRQGSRSMGCAQPDLVETIIQFSTLCTEHNTERER